MNDYISKPIQLAELVAALTRCGDAPRPGPQPGTQAPNDAPIDTPIDAPIDAPIDGLAIQPDPGSRVADSASEVIIDPEVLDELRALLGDDDSAVSRLLEEFCGDTEELLAEMERACAAEQAEPLQRAAHTLKSTTRTVGAVRMSALARELEHLARAGRLTAASDMLPPLAREYARVKQSLGAALSRARAHPA